MDHQPRGRCPRATVVLEPHAQRAHELAAPSPVGLDDGSQRPSHEGVQRGRVGREPGRIVPVLGEPSQALRGILPVRAPTAPRGRCRGPRRSRTAADPRRATSDLSEDAGGIERQQHVELPLRQEQVRDTSVGEARCTTDPSTPSSSSTAASATGRPDPGRRARSACSPRLGRARRSTAPPASRLPRDGSPHARARGWRARARRPSRCAGPPSARRGPHRRGRARRAGRPCDGRAGS